MRSNRAQGQGTIVKVIIALTVLIILGSVIVSRSLEIIKDKANTNVCKANVLTQVKLDIKPISFVQEINDIINDRQIDNDIDCPTEEIVIQKEDLKTVGTVSAKAAKDTIGEAMCECWDKFLRGQYEIFETSDDTEMYCVVCNHISFEEKGEKIDDFGLWLKNSKYFQCLSGYESTSEELAGFESDITSFLQKNQHLEINTDDDYVINFVYFKKGYITQLKASVLGFGAGTLLALIPGIGWGVGAGIIIASSAIGYTVGSEDTADWKTGIALVPYQVDYLKNLSCTYLPAKQESG